MPFLPPNQQRQSTEGKKEQKVEIFNLRFFDFFVEIFRYCL